MAKSCSKISKSDSKSMQKNTYQSEGSEKVIRTKASGAFPDLRAYPCDEDYRCHSCENNGKWGIPAPSHRVDGVRLGPFRYYGNREIGKIARHKERKPTKVDDNLKSDNEPQSMDQQVYNAVGNAQLSDRGL
jgi:hypothetical protein